MTIREIKGVAKRYRDRMVELKSRPVEVFIYTIDGIELMVPLDSSLRVRELLPLDGFEHLEGMGG